MQFNVSHVEPGSSPNTLAVKGQFSGFAMVVVDTSANPVTATVSAGLQCDATKEAIASAVANAINLAGVENVQRLERQGIPISAPVRKPAPVSAAEAVVEPGAVVLKSASTVAPESQPSAPPTTPASPAVSARQPGPPAATAAG
jgi:hypothetical protein